MADLFPIILVTLLVLHVALVFWLIRSNRLERWGLSLMLGIVIMQRTQRGKPFIDWVARPRRFWNLVGDLGIVLTLGGMVAITGFFLWSAFKALQPGSGVPKLSVQEIFVIPGVNPFVPLWYGLAALAITLVVHEGGHGILARANGMKLKSLGLLWLVVPIGAFVEPEELDLKVAPRKMRLRVFGAGPAVNLAFATIALVCFALLMGSLAPKAGAWIGSVSASADGQDGPAKAAGIHEGDILVSANVEPIGNWTALGGYLGRAHPGDAVDIGSADGRHTTVVLARYWDQLSESGRANVSAGTEMGFCARTLSPPPASGPECAERLQAKAFLGVEPRVAEQYTFTAHPLEEHGIGLLRLAALPIAEVIGHEPTLSVFMPAFYDTPFHSGTFWILVNLLFWIFWINVMVGITNILPMLPLDGGHIFREAVGGAVAKLNPRMAAERRERFVSVAATAMSFLILGAFMVQILAPHIVNGFS